MINSGFAHLEISVFVFHFFLFFKILVFIWKSWEREKERERKERLIQSSDLHNSQIHCPDRHNSQSSELGWTKFRSQGFHLGLPGGRVPSTWTVFYFFSQAMSKELDQNWSTRSWTSAHLGCPCHRWQLYQQHCPSFLKDHFAGYGVLGLQVFLCNLYDVI